MLLPSSLSLGIDLASAYFMVVALLISFHTAEYLDVAPTGPTLHVSTGVQPFMFTHVAVVVYRSGPKG